MLVNSSTGPFAQPAAPGVGTAISQSGSANTYGSYTQIVASLGADNYVVGVRVGCTSATNPTYCAVNLGVGAAASETSKGALPIAVHPNGTVITGSVILPFPIAYSSGDRVSAKVASDVASALSWNVQLQMITKSSLIDSGIEESADMQTIKTQSVTCSAGVTVNPTVGLTNDQLALLTVLTSGTAQTGSTSSTIKLASGASSTDSMYIPCLVYITGGTGVGQGPRIGTAYVGSTRVMSVSPSWTTTPDNTTTYALLPMGAADLESWRGVVPLSLSSQYVQADASAVTVSANVTQIGGSLSAPGVAKRFWDNAIVTGTAQSGGASAITLAVGSSTTADYYTGAAIVIVGGTGVGQTRKITAYSGSGLVATVDQNWVTTPDNTSIYQILGRLV